MIHLLHISSFYRCYRALLRYLYNSVQLLSGKKRKKKLCVRLRYAAREFASLIAEFCRLRTSRQRVCPLPLKVYTVCLALRRANSRNSRNSRNQIRFRSARRRFFFLHLPFIHPFFSCDSRSLNIR